MSNASRRQRGREAEKIFADYLVRNGFKTAHVTSMAASGSDVLGVDGVDWEVKARQAWIKVQSER